MITQTVKRIFYALIFILTITSCSRTWGVIESNSPENIKISMENFLNKPNSVIIVEQSKDKYWVYFYGRYTRPTKSEASTNNIEFHFSDGANKSQGTSKIIESIGSWEMLKVGRGGYPYMINVLEELNKIKKHKTVKLITKKNDSKQDIYILYKK